jgi:hypothetical protein
MNDSIERKHGEDREVRVFDMAFSRSTATLISTTAELEEFVSSIPHFSTLYLCGVFGVFKVKVHAIFFGTQGFSARRDGRYPSLKKRHRGCIYSYRGQSSHNTRHASLRYKGYIDIVLDKCRL